MSAQTPRSGSGAGSARPSADQLRAALLALVAEEPRTADELAAAIGVSRALARNALASLALVDVVVRGDVEGRYHILEEPP